MTSILDLPYCAGQVHTHGHSQLKHHKLRVASCAAQAPKIEDGQLYRGGAWMVQHPTQIWSYLPVSICIIASSVLCRGQPGSKESCIMLENGPTCNLVAKLPQHLLLAVHKFRAASKERCKWGHERKCVNLWFWMSLYLKHIRTIAVSTWAKFMIHYARI